MIGPGALGSARQLHAVRVAGTRWCAGRLGRHRHARRRPSLACAACAACATSAAARAGRSRRRCPRRVLGGVGWPPVAGEHRPPPSTWAWLPSCRPAAGRRSSPWIPDQPLFYHYGVDLLISLLAPPFGPDLPFATEVLSAYIWTGFAVTVATLLLRRGGWISVVMLTPLLLTAGAWTLVGFVIPPPDILQIPVPAGPPAAGLRASLVSLYWPEVTLKWQTTYQASPPNIWNPHFVLAYALASAVLERAAAPGERTWISHAALALLIGFLGLLSEGIALAHAGVVGRSRSSAGASADAHFVISHPPMPYGIPATVGIQPRSDQGNGDGGHAGGPPMATAAAAGSRAGACGALAGRRRRPYLGPALRNTCRGSLLRLDRGPCRSAPVWKPRNYGAGRLGGAGPRGRPDRVHRAAAGVASASGSSAGRRQLRIPAGRARSSVQALPIRRDADGRARAQLCAAGAAGCTQRSVVGPAAALALCHRCGFGGRWSLGRRSRHPSGRWGWLSVTAIRADQRATQPYGAATPPKVNPDWMRTPSGH